MYELFSFAVVSIVMIISAIGIFYQKRIMHSVVLLSIAFISSAFVFFILNQNFIAFLQLFIFVGGMSTYLIISVSSEFRKTRMIDFMKICIVAIAITISISIGILNFHYQNSQVTVSQGFSNFFVYAFQQYYSIIFTSVIMIFLVAIGSVVVIRRFVRLVT